MLLMVKKMHSQDYSPKRFSRLRLVQAVMAEKFWFAQLTQWSAECTHPLSVAWVKFFLIFTRFTFIGLPPAFYVDLSDFVVL
jgi:hypothetical protein